MRRIIGASLALAAAGAGITVNGQQQPPLTDQGGTVAALVDQVVHVSWAL